MRRAAEASRLPLMTNDKVVRASVPAMRSDRCMEPPIASSGSFCVNRQSLGKVPGTYVAGMGRTLLECQRGIQSGNQSFADLLVLVRFMRNADQPIRIRTMLPEARQD